MFINNVDSIYFIEHRQRSRDATAAEETNESRAHGR